MLKYSNAELFSLLPLVDDAVIVANKYFHPKKNNPAPVQTIIKQSPGLQIKQDNEDDEDKPKEYKLPGLMKQPKIAGENFKAKSIEDVVKIINDNLKFKGIHGASVEEMNGKKVMVIDSEPDNLPDEGEKFTPDQQKQVDEFANYMKNKFGFEMYFRSKDKPLYKMASDNPDDNDIAKHIAGLSKREIIKRIQAIRNIKNIQVNDPSSKTNDYMQGLANGLIMADYSLFEPDKHLHPYDQHPPFIERKKEANLARERDMELYHSWKQNPSPETLSLLMKQIEPIVKMESNKYLQSTINPVLVQTEAKNLAFQALKTYDPSKSQLNTHLINSLKKLSRYSINMQNSIRVPEESIYNYRKVQKVREELEQKLDREPTDLEVKEQLGNFGRLGDFKPQIEHFYSQASESGNLPAMAEITSHATAMHLLHDKLSSRQQEIFRHAFGYEGAPIIESKKIAEKLGVSAPFISKQKKLIEKKLREHMDATQLIMGN